MFFKGSRYAKVPEAEITAASGRVVRYKRTRFIEETAAQVGHRMIQGQRLDHIAWEYYRDPERFWRICDANRALWPADLTASAGVLLIPPSEG